MFRFALICLLLLSVPAGAETPPADSMSLLDMEGQSHEVDALLASGRNVVLVFWQTWCGPCKREAPGLAVAAREHADGLEFFGVIAGTDTDVDEKKVRRYVEKFELPYAQIRDRDLSLVKQYEVVATPTILVLGPGREILYRGNHPPKDWAEFEPAASGE